MKHTLLPKSTLVILSILMTIGIIIPIIFTKPKQEKTTSQAIVPQLLTKINLQQAVHEPSLALSDYPHLIKQEEEMLWQELANSGITAEEYAKTCNAYKDEYDAIVEMLKKRDAIETPLSETTITFIHKIMHECDIDPTTITIVPTNSASTAAAADTALFVNESSLQQHALDVKKFAIAHECTHIKNKDHSTRYYIKRACLDKQQDITSWQHPYNKMRHLHEMRADITPCLKGLDYAQGCKQFYAQHMQAIGDYESADQPKSSLRLATATKIVAIMQNISV